MRRDPCPYPVPRAYIRALCRSAVGPDAPPTSMGQREAARMLKTSERGVRYWCSDTEPKVCPWASAELLRRLIIEKHGPHVVPDPADYPPDVEQFPPVVGNTHAEP